MKLWVYRFRGREIHTFHTSIRNLCAPVGHIANGRARAADRAS